MDSGALLSLTFGVLSSVLTRNLEPETRNGSLSLLDLFFSRREIVAFDGAFGFLFILVGPRAETVAIPRHARFERRQFELLPNLLGALLLVRERATGIPARGTGD